MEHISLGQILHLPGRDFGNWTNKVKDRTCLISFTLTYPCQAAKKNTYIGLKGKKYVQLCGFDVMVSVNEGRCVQKTHSNLCLHYVNEIFSLDFIT